MSSISVLFAGFVAASAAASPQEPSVDQVSAKSARIEIQQPAVEKSAAAPEQLARGDDHSPSTSQVSREQRPTRPPEQLSDEGKTALSPKPLSTPSEGRQVGVDRLAGADRCDPAERSFPKSICRKVIENRSAEFARPDANALSPEQRLLLEQDVREGALDAQSAARRLSETGEADESLAAMGVAAVVLQPKDEPPPAKDKDEDTAKAAEILGAIIGQPPPPPPPQ